MAEKEQGGEVGCAYIVKVGEEQDYGIFTRGSEVNPLLLTLYEVPRRPCLAGCSRTRALIPQKLPRILTFAPGDGTAEENTNIFVIETRISIGSVFHHFDLNGESPWQINNILLSYVDKNHFLS